MLLIAQKTVEYSITFFKKKKIAAERKLAEEENKINENGGGAQLEHGVGLREWGEEVLFLSKVHRWWGLILPQPSC